MKKVLLSFLTASVMLVSGLTQAKADIVTPQPERVRVLSRTTDGSIIGLTVTLDSLKIIDVAQAEIFFTIALQDGDTTTNIGVVAARPPAHTPLDFVSPPLPTAYGGQRTAYAVIVDGLHGCEDITVFVSTKLNLEVPPWTLIDQVTMDMSAVPFATTASPVTSVYPNPSTGAFTVVNENYSGQTYLLYDATSGKKVAEIPATEKETKVSVQLPAGIYLLLAGASVHSIVIQ